jgi:hypothetical protein
MTVERSQEDVSREYQQMMLGMLIQQLEGNDITMVDVHREFVETYAYPAWQTYQPTGQKTITIKVEKRREQQADR